MDQGKPPLVSGSRAVTQPTRARGCSTIVIFTIFTHLHQIRVLNSMPTNISLERANNELNTPVAVHE